MKPCVYILCLANGQYYVGSTDDVKRRIAEHNAGKTPGIKYKLPAKLIFQQEFETLRWARQIEYWIKRQKSRKIIDKIINKEIDFNKILGAMGP